MFRETKANLEKGWNILSRSGMHCEMTHLTKYSTQDNMKEDVREIWCSLPLDISSKSQTLIV
jgi:hypothetical protein